jgi:hypothetical protein
MNAITDKFYRKQTINEREYQISMLPALKAVGMGRTLAKVLLPAIGGAIDGLRDDGIMGTPSTFTDLAVTLCTQLDDLDLDNLILTLTKGLTCEGNEVKDINTHFQGDLGELIAVLEFALRENFSSFFTGSDISIRLTEALKGLTEGT